MSAYKKISKLLAFTLYIYLFFKLLFPFLFNSRQIFLQYFPIILSSNFIHNLLSNILSSHQVSNQPQSALQTHNIIKQLSKNIVSSFSSFKTHNKKNIYINPQIIIHDYVKSITDFPLRQLTISRVFNTI